MEHGSPSPMNPIMKEKLSFHKLRFVGDKTSTLVLNVCVTNVSDMNCSKN